jgi:hypothetical protein
MRDEEAEAYASMARAEAGKRNLPGIAPGAESRTAADGETKPEALRLMEAAVERSNMLCAYERVVKNQGASGVDGRTVAMATGTLGEGKTGAVGGRVYAGGGA